MPIQAGHSFWAVVEDNPSGGRLCSMVVFAVVVAGDSSPRHRIAAAGQGDNSRSRTVGAAVESCHTRPGRRACNLPLHAVGAAVGSQVEVEQGGSPAGCIVMGIVAVVGAVHIQVVVGHPVADSAVAAREIVEVSSECRITQVHLGRAVSSCYSGYSGYSGYSEGLAGPVDPFLLTPSHSSL
jgi:hypothetical protein